MPRSSVTPQSYFDLIETFPKPGCAMCNLLTQLAEKSVQKIVYEWSTDVQTHQSLRDRRGLCSTHSYQLLHHVGNALTVTTLYRITMDEILTILNDMSLKIEGPRGRLAGLFGSGASVGASLAERLAPSAPCFICESIDRTEGYYVDVMANRLGDHRLREAYLKSEGLCLPHFQKTLSVCGDPGIAQDLITKQLDVWGKFREELEAYIARGDHRGGYEEKSRDVDAWRRFAQQIPGEYTLFGVDPRSRE